MSSVHKYIALLFIALYTGGCASLKRGMEYQRDSVITTIREEVVMRDSIIFVPIPAEEERAVLLDTDTSRLETALAASDAWVGGGRLHHTLRQKEMLLPVEVKLPKYIYTKNDNIIREQCVVETIEVEKQLSKWQRFIQALGYGLLLSFVIWLAVRLVRIY